ncbi:hypothetical protein HNQ94_000074 [Salirhabdus euzebyi]|uniref:Lipoprotein n=1 Tax=Salirhabdus euzebyi TaxID=394506 RepID=A0A841Q113_9BACI|nr:hypothetical protein [Salirhabdus euzebyi]MBB6451653.1 hypothetical protein [Salirhabdus euzebyi]
MNKLIIVIFLSLSSVLFSCSSIESVLSEEEAKSIVVEHRTAEFGVVEIKSVTTKFNKYIIEWENKENCEHGTDIVNKNGEVKTEEYNIC